MHRGVAALPVGSQNRFTGDGRGRTKQRQFVVDDADGVAVFRVILGQDLIQDAAVRAVEIREERYRQARVFLGSEQRRTGIGANVRRRMIWNSGADFGAEGAGSSGSGYAA